MQEDLELLKKEISRVIKLIENNDWRYAKLTIQFAPFINKAFKAMPFFSGVNSEKLRVIPDFDESFQSQLYSFVVKYNQQNSFNQVVFKTARDEYEEASIDISFNQEVEDSFQKNLPKSMRGKTIPWWKNPDETKGLI